MIRRLRHGEQGAVAVLTVLTLFVLFGSAMIAVDAGSLWTTRRSLITDTDAAVLAAAAYFDMNPSAACDPGGVNEGRERAVELLEANGPDTSLVSFDVDPVDCANGAGKVSVTGRAPASLFFAPVFDITEAHASATSIAQYGPLVAVEGARPVAICKDDPHYVEWLTDTHDPALDGQHPNGSYPGATTTVHRISFEKKHDSACGDAPGNWGWLDFNGSKPPNGNAALAEWIVRGYGGEITTTDCNPESSGDQECEPKTGAGGDSLAGALGEVRCDSDVATGNCDGFPIVIFETVTCKGGGSNCRYDQVAFVSIVLRGWGKITGKESSHPSCVDDPDPKTCPYFDIEFVKILEQGRVGGSASGIPTVHGVELCGGEYGGVLDDFCTY